MAGEATGTSGGLAGTGGLNGAQRRIALGLAAGFLIIVGVIAIANAESTIADLRAAGVAVTAGHVWIWELTSIAAWLSEGPAIWWAVGRVRRRRPVWPWVAALLVLGTAIASAWHIGLMVALRHAVYWLNGERYAFNTGLADPILYEVRKDVGTFLQFAGVAFLVQWLIVRAATPVAVAPAPATPAPRALAVPDGAVTHLVPVDEIDWVGSAANYVEIAWGRRTMLHRATLAAVAAELGDAFVRIGRGRLVRRAAIRRVVGDRSGDYTVELASGASLRGSRRYRLDG